MRSMIYLLAEFAIRLDHSNTLILFKGTGGTKLYFRQGVVIWF